MVCINIEFEFINLSPSVSQLHGYYKRECVVRVVCVCVCFEQLRLNRIDNTYGTSKYIIYRCLFVHVHVHSSTIYGNYRYIHIHYNAGTNIVGPL